VAEGARLESVFRGNSNVGSNPTLSAIIESNTYGHKQIKAGNCGQYILYYLRANQPLSPAPPGL
jgi:hypothetical protein